MRLFNLIIFTFLPSILLGQEIAKEFPNLLFKDDFSSANNVWNQTFNIDNLFVKQATSFDLIRKNQETGYFVLPNLEAKQSSFEIKVGLQLISYSKKPSAAGVLVMADLTKSGGILVEVNELRQYKISRVYRDRIVPLTKGKDGWIKNTFAVTKAYNEIWVKSHDKVYDLYINQKFITTFTDMELTKGGFGLYIGPASRASFDFVVLNGEEQGEPVKTNREVVENPEDLALTNVILKLRKDLTSKDEEIEMLRTRLKECAGNSPAPNRPNTTTNDAAVLALNKELQTKVKELQAENDLIRGELLKAKAESMRLQKFKDEVQNQQSGDIVISLTNLVSTQKEKIAEVQSENKVLREELIKQKGDLSAISNQIQKRDARITKLEEQNNSLDSTVRIYRDILRRYNINPENPIAPVDEKIESPKNEKEKSDDDFINELLEKRRKEEEEKRRSRN
jgi:hypothetical protein